jgi:hypothetical protein
MMNRTIAAAAIMLVVMQQDAISKVFRENDNSSNNTCAYVHEWFKKTARKHAVFVTLGGIDYRRKLQATDTCQAGGGPTLAGARDYAIGWCTKIARKHHSSLQCKVMESR